MKEVIGLMNKNEIEDRILHDYRSDIIEKALNKELWYRNAKREKEYWDKTKWEEWKTWGILRRTIEYELSHGKDVEGYDFVKKSAFACYKNEMENYCTADIMNGWWFCFKTIFHIKTTRDKAKGIEEEILEFIENENETGLLKRFQVDETEYQVLLKYLRVVYTTGNITLAPINPGGKGYGQIDFWEYKLARYRTLYHDYNGDIKKLYFNDYKEFDIQTNYSDFINDLNIVNYINERIDLILKRGYRILNKGNAISDDDLNCLKSKI